MTKSKPSSPLVFAIELIFERLFSGIIPVLVKLTAANTFEIGIFRLLVAALLFLGIISVQGKRIVYTRKNLLPCIVAGVSFGLHWITYFYSIKLSTVTIGTIGISAYGIFLMVIGNLFFHERITKRELFALLIAITGSLVVLPSYELTDSMTVGFLLSLSSALLFAITAAVQKSNAEHSSFETRTFSQYLFALLVFLPFSFKTHWQLAASDWIYLILLAVFGTLVAHTLWIKAVEQLTLKTAGIVYYLAAFFSILAGVLILNESLSYRTLLGGAMIIFASIMAALKSQSQKKVMKMVSE